MASGFFRPPPPPSPPLLLGRGLLEGMDLQAVINALPDVQPQLLEEPVKPCVVPEKKSPLLDQSQKQLLEMQLLVYKHIVMGLQIPPELVSAVFAASVSSQRAALGLSKAPQMAQQSQLLAAAFDPWGPLVVGIGGTAADADGAVDQPLRCRRTDGKKWRCTKPVLPMQKYCETHLHRGRQRSKKGSLDSAREGEESGEASPAVTAAAPSFVEERGNPLAEESAGAPREPQPAQSARLEAPGEWPRPEEPLAMPCADLGALTDLLQANCAASNKSAAPAAAAVAVAMLAARPSLALDLPIIDTPSSRLGFGTVMRATGSSLPSIFGLSAGEGDCNSPRTLLPGALDRSDDVGLLTDVLFPSRSSPCSSPLPLSRLLAGGSGPAAGAGLERCDPVALLFGETDWMPPSLLRSCTRKADAPEPAFQPAAKRQCPDVESDSLPPFA